jgi:hypothetical protein
VYFCFVVVINKGFTDNGHFVQCLTSLIINSTFINLTDQCIDFYRKAFDDEEIEVKRNIYLIKYILNVYLDSYSCTSMS